VATVMERSRFGVITKSRVLVRLRVWFRVICHCRVCVLASGRFRVKFRFRVMANAWVRSLRLRLWLLFGYSLFTVRGKSSVPRLS
jgi:hypothetical protein